MALPIMQKVFSTWRRQKEPLQQMIISNRILYILILAFIVVKANAQDYDYLCKRTLLFNKTNKQYHYKSKDGVDIFINNLGMFNTNRNKKYKVLTLRSVWGPNKHTNGYIWIYGINDKYIGKYVLGDARDLPLKLKNSYLIFSNKDKDCDSVLYKEIDFRFGIPKEIFIPACGKYGDIYQFTQ